MVVDFLFYSLNTMGIQLLFLLFYKLFFSKKTFFTANRIYLLSAILLSFIIPILKISVKELSLTENNATINTILLNSNTISNLNSENSSVSVIKILTWIYFIGLTINSVFFFLKINTIFFYYKTSTIEKIGNTKVYRIKNSNDAFSFLNFIFIGENNTETTTILNHELVHLQKLHSLDLLALECVKIFFWFNPFIYIFQKLLAEIHEFEADKIASKSNKKSYYESIISQLFQVENFAFTNNFFNQSLIKKRIIMLRKSNSKKTELVKYILVIPLIIVSVLLFANCKNDTQQEVITLNNSYEPDEENIVPFVMVEKAPYFESCEKNENLRICFQKELDKYVKTNLIIPDDVPAGTRGRIYVSFIIDEEGFVQNTTLTINNDKLKPIEKNVYEIFEKLPQLIPAENQGKKVKVKFVYPLFIKTAK